MKQATVVVFRGILGGEKELIFNFSELEDFKQSLLKRLGNVSVSGQLEKERTKVKEVIYNNESISSLEDEIRHETNWNIKIYI